METNIKRIGLINGIVLLVAAAGLAALSQLVVSSAAIMAGVLATTGLLVALLSFFQMGLEERERFEKLELDELKKSAGSASIF